MNPLDNPITIRLTKFSYFTWICTFTS